jgi:hypothetical protein
MKDLQGGMVMLNMAKRYLSAVWRGFDTLVLWPSASAKSIEDIRQRRAHISTMEDLDRRSWQMTGDSLRQAIDKVGRDYHLTPKT